MEQLTTLGKQQEESSAESTSHETITNVSNSIQNKETPTDVTTRPENSQVTQDTNLLYEQCLGFIPGALSGKRDPRYLYAKFPKDYKEFDFTYEDILEVLEEGHLLQYLEILQISKPNKSINVYFTTEDAAQFFVNKHIKIRGKLIPFIRKAKHILKVTINGIHPDLTDDELRSELYEYVTDPSLIPLRASFHGCVQGKNKSSRNSRSNFHYSIHSRSFLFNYMPKSKHLTVNCKLRNQVVQKHDFD